MHQTKHAWNDFFSGNLAPTLNSSEYSSRQTLSASSVYVSNCLFKSIMVTSVNGGALYVTSTTYLLIESSSFFSCKTSNAHGGALYLSNSGGQCVLYKVCGYDCYSTYSGSNSPCYQFSYIGVKDDATSKNYVNYSSITRCINENSNSHYTLYHDYGKISYPSVNISMIKCQYYSAIYCAPSSDSNSVTCSFSYSSITDNTASGHTCIWFNRNGPKYEMKYCNILRNKEVSSSNGIFYVPGNWIIEDCCILENTATYIFYVWSSSTLTLSNCTVDKTTNNGRLTMQNTVTKSFIHGLNHISTRNCYSEYDSAAYLTAVPYVSRSTKRLFCYTFKMNQYQARISDFISLHCLFMVTFIHTNSS
jgi:hypothetical protein